MPLFEFRCLKCDDVFEMLVISEKEEIEMKCPKCGAEDFERVMSTTSYAMGASSTGGSADRSIQSRQCSGGTCSTVTLPGHSKD